MFNKFVVFVISVLLAQAVMGQEPRDISKAKEGYLSQLKFAKQAYVQKMEKINKSAEPKKEEVDLARTTYQSQVKFAEESYVKKLETYTKTPGRPKVEIEAIKSEIARFREQMTNGNAPLPEIQGQGVDDAGKVAKATDKTKEAEGDVKGKAVAVKDPAEDEEDEQDSKGDVSGDVAGVGVPGEKFSEVKADKLDDGLSVKADALKANLQDLTADWLKENREFASGRPRPETYDFKQDAIKSYLAGLPEAKREIEEKRYKQVASIKDYIVRLMERNTYPKPVTLKDGDTMRGIMVNPNFISVKSGRKKFTRMGWDSVPPDQIANILEYFAEFRMKASGGPAVPENQKRNEVAEDYVRIGIFCDWYGDYESAVKYAKKAISVEPKAENVVKKFIMQ